MGTLYLVATPIGNLGDISARALETLRLVDVIAAEDTRVTRKLVSHFQIKTQLISYHEHSGPAATQALIYRIKERGESVALVTDAGTPGISDPGIDLVQAAVQSGITVVPIPGPAAFVAAIVGSGVPSARFVFEGFLPRTKSTRLQRIEELKYEPRSVIIYEAPRRIGSTLSEIGKIFGTERRGCVARELTKLHEEFRRSTLGALSEFYSSNETRGECVIVVAGFEGERPNLALQAAEEDAPVHGKDLIRQLAAEIGVPRRELYQLILEIKNRQT